MVLNYSKEEKHSFTCIQQFTLQIKTRKNREELTIIFTCKSQYPSVNFNYLDEQTSTVVITKHDVYAAKRQRK